ncbi:DEAD/DEAH box helicase [Motiliproteus sp.]|uniref:DEAD/DEAH box helicase n=1 Tax=Motiliproteus sp. TaxID=1898955 RepID=UPI003BAD21C9
MFSDLPLHERLQKALAELNLQQPTEVQQQALPKALDGKDLLISAETGSGKTAAYLLPSLHRFLESDAPRSGTRGLVLLPTRELARQVFKQFKQLSAFSHLQAGLITGGDDFKYQRSIFRKNPELIIATPGRMLEHIKRNSCDLSDLEVLVLDEADRMLDLGFAEDVLAIADSCRPERQTLLLSATLKTKGLMQVIDRVLRDPEELILSGARDLHGNIRQQIVLADDRTHKERLLHRLLEKESYAKVIVFTNTKAQAERLGGAIRYRGHRTGVLQGDMTQDDRNKVMDWMRRGSINILVATDVAARGLDISGVDLVINFDMARSGDEHVHRVGRTGRAGESGLAISLISASEWNLMASIERYLRLQFERRLVPGLEGKYKGPAKLKSSGKAAGVGKRNKGRADKRRGDSEAGSKKPKQRLRDQKSIGKRRKPSANKPAAERNEQPGSGALGDGLAPFTKRR